VLHQGRVLVGCLRAHATRDRPQTRRRTSEKLRSSWRLLVKSVHRQQLRSRAESASRVEISELRELQDTLGGDERKLDELANRIDWDTCIFEERHKTISYACEVPVLIEQRLLALARAIQQAIE
jgi:hypothetical protein